MALCVSHAPQAVHPHVPACYSLKHVLEELLGRLQLHALDGMHDLAGVLEVHAQRGAAGLGA